MLLIVSFVVSFGESPRHSFAFIWLALGAMFVALVNFYLSFVRPWLLVGSQGSLEGVRHVSGIPLVGTILAMIGGVLGFSASGTAFVGLVAMTLDTGGAPWFLISTWHQSALWDTRG
jgi:hypothetical protein